VKRRAEPPAATHSGASMANTFSGVLKV
jgi:hypothetical protein